MPLPEDVADWLEDNGYGTVSVDIFVARMPPTPDEVIVVVENPGGPPDHAFGRTTMVIDAPMIQIAVRGTPDGWDVARDVAYGVYEELDSGGSFDGGSTQVKASGTPAYLGPDELERPEFSVNFSVTRCRR